MIIWVYGWSPFFYSHFELSSILGNETGFYQAKKGWINRMADKMVKRYEVDLYEPIKKYFTELGYAVYGEVKDCDVVALKEKELIVIELKLTINITLLIQATKRQRMTDQVFIAIPKPKERLRSGKWRDLFHLVRRLELGLIFVTFEEEIVRAKVVIQPGPFNRTKSMQLSKKRKSSLLKEIEGRSGDFNIGGSYQTELISAYKESSIHIACCLKKYGELSPKKLKEMGTGEKTATILSKNYYGWFDRVQRGVYVISEQGHSALDLYPTLVAYYEKIRED